MEDREEKGREERAGMEGREGETHPSFANISPPCIGLEFSTAGRVL